MTIEEYSTIFRTNDYSLFVLTQKNRRVRPENAAKIGKSIKEEEMGSIYPIVVDKKYRVIDGQHRFVIRRDLKLPIYFLVSEKDYDPYNVMLANTNTFRWKIMDYMENLTRQGNPHCQRALDDANRYHLPITILLASVGISVSNTLLRSGKFNYTHPQQEAAYRLFSEIEMFSNYQFCRHLKFIKAYKSFRTLKDTEGKGYDPQKMEKSIMKYGNILTPQRSRSNYFFKLIELHNYGRKKADRIHLPGIDIFENWGDA